MSDDAYGATVAKRRLSRRLTEFRINAGYTANHVCDILNWGRGKVGRFEANQWKRPEMSDIRDLIRIYQIEGAAREEIEDLAVRCRVRPWWREYGEIFDNEFPGYENDATSIRVYMPLVLPGLLQTPAYMEAQLKTGPRSPAWRRKAADARLRRQEILARRPAPPQTPASAPAPRLSVVITEASLLYRWGMPARTRRGDRVPRGDEPAWPDVDLRDPAVRRRPADRHLLDGRHLRLPRAGRAAPGVRGDGLLRRRGEQAGIGPRLHPVVRARKRRRARTR